MSNVGTDFSPEDCITILESQLKNTVKDISSLTTKNKDLYTEYLSATPALSAPKEIMNTLKNDSLIDFPEIKIFPASSKMFLMHSPVLPPVHSTLYRQSTAPKIILFT